MRPVFLTKEKNSTCSVCNPVRLAALGCEVVVVKSPVTTRRLAVCGDCVDALHRSARGARRVTITLPADVQELALEKERRKKGTQ